MKKFRARLIKNDKIINVLHDVTKVEVNEKYGYFEITQHIYHHDLINVVRFNAVDKVVTMNGITPVKEYTYESH